MADEQPVSPQGQPQENAPTAEARPVRSTYDQLRARDRLFVDEYVKLSFDMTFRQHGCGAEAMRRSGYSGKFERAREHAWRKMSKPEVRAAIAERRAELLEAAGVEATAVLLSVVSVARFNPKQLRDETGALKPVHELPDEVAAAICGEEFDANGKLLKYRTHSKPEAQRLLMQHLRLLGQQVEVSGPKGQPIPVAGTTVVIVKQEDARKIAQELDERV